MDRESIIARAKEHFSKLIEEQFERIEMMKKQENFIDYDKLDTLVIGIVGGDGIGPYITAQAQRILEFLLQDKAKQKNIEFKIIDGLTIENRVKHNKAIPDDVLEQLKQCHVILKGPTTTPRAGDPWPNIESANVAMRKELDLFANVRPVKIPRKESTGPSSVRIPRVPMLLEAKAFMLMKIWPSILPSLPMKVRIGSSRQHLIMPVKPV